MNTSNRFEISYPRLTFRRKILNLVGRALLRLLARPQVSGLEHIPAEGPVILAGNHVSTLEPLLMAVYPHRQVELIGAGDLPFEGFIDKLVAFYGFIPVNRGNLDRKAMVKALGVLEQAGVLGIYPEGGTWNPGRMKAQVGVAWLSHKAQAPVIPIGFSGFHNGFSKVLKFERPTLKMSVGEPIPAFRLDNDSLTVKDAYQKYADLVLERINSLVDPADFLLVPQKSDHAMRLRLESEGGSSEMVEIVGLQALAEFLFTPVMLNSLANNLKKPVQPLYPTEQTRQNKQFSEALQAVLDVLDENPGFLTYRMGVEQGHLAESAVRLLLQLLDTAHNTHKTIILDATMHAWYRDGRVEAKTHQYRITP